MKLVQLRDSVAERADAVGAAALGVMLFAAGSSKFVLPELWTGFEPALLASVVEPDLIMFGSGVVESLLGLWIAAGWRREAASGLAALWLSGITLQMARLGLWDLFIRDIGLTGLAVYVYLRSL